LVDEREMKCVVKGCSGGFLYVNEKWCVYWILLMIDVVIILREFNDG